MALWPWEVSSYICTNQYSAEHSRRTSPGHQCSLSVKFSTLQYSVMQILAALVSMEFSFSPQEVHRATPGSLLSVLWLGTSLRQYSWEVLWLTSFVSNRSGITVLCCQMSIVLKIVVPYVLSFLLLLCCYFRWENISSPFYSTSAGSRCPLQAKSFSKAIQLTCFFSLELNLCIPSHNSFHIPQFLKISDNVSTLFCSDFLENMIFFYKIFVLR